MYLKRKKSMISASLIVLGAAALVFLAVLFCFTELKIPAGVYLSLWALSILAVVRGGNM